MNAPAATTRSAWLPLTPRGVAAFAGASNGRLWLVQFAVALLAAAAFAWFLRTAWVPPIRAAISQLPAGAQIQNGVLEWPEDSPRVLAEGHFLGVVVDLDHSGSATSTSHLQVQFGRRDWQVSSLLGVLDLPALVNPGYPATNVIVVDRTELEPWWGAREPFFILLAAGGLVVCLMLSWALLALLYSLPAWWVGFLANRAVDWRGSWRLAGAALLPGALLVSGAIVLYGLRMFDLVKFAFAFGLHLVVGWLYVLVSPLFLARHPGVPPAAKNPFDSAA